MAVRFGNFLGSEGSVIPYLKSKLLKGTTDDNPSENNQIFYDNSGSFSTGDSGWRFR